MSFSKETESSAVPESYRPLISIIFGVWGWVVVLSILNWQRIDVNALLYTPSSHLQPLFILATALTLLISFHIRILELTTFSQHSNLFNHFGPVILCYVLAASLIFFGPCRTESRRLINCLCRLLFKLQGKIYFSDVLVADILISFSGILTGMFVNLMENTSLPYNHFVPVVTSLPYLIRLKQCFNMYSGSSNKRQLMNAFKYGSAIPVIFLAHRTKLDKNGPDSYEALLWHLWYVFAAFNNLFAFAWDVIIDWGIVQLETGAFIRKDLHFSDPFSYALAIGINGCIRLLKIESHLHHIHPFWIDLAEIARRWTWVIFRFENEWIKRSYLEPN